MVALLRPHGAVIAALAILLTVFVAWSTESSAPSPFPGSIVPGGEEISVAAGVGVGVVVPSTLSAVHCTPNQPTFFEAVKNETDKVTTHHYQHAYQAHLAPRRCEVKDFLEIGLGCGMPYGYGFSARMWLNYLPQAKVSVMEYVKRCATDFAQTNPLDIPTQHLQRLRVFSGDQSVPEHLLAVASASGPYDVVIDDGGHTMKQQLVTLATLLPYVKPGGLFIIEDMGTSGVSEYITDKEIKWTTAEYISAMVSS